MQQKTGLSQGLRNVKSPDYGKNCITLQTKTDMKGLLLAVLLGMLPCAMSSEGTTVYISTGKSAEVYHRVITCRTLKRCREEGHVKSVPLEQAVRLRRRPCKVCYK